MLKKCVLSVSALRIERGGTVILHDVNWRVQRGQHWVISARTVPAKLRC
jgi:ABC-type molybdenum transport system ATPase subunit/photorepair protein PhrA